MAFGHILEKKKNLKAVNAVKRVQNEDLHTSASNWNILNVNGKGRIKRTVQSENPSSREGGSAAVGPSSMRSIPWPDPAGTAQEREQGPF